MSITGRKKTGTTGDGAQASKHRVTSLARDDPASRQFGDPASTMNPSAFHNDSQQQSQQQGSSQPPAPSSSTANNGGGLFLPNNNNNNNTTSMDFNSTSQAGFNAILGGMDLDLDPAVLAAAAAAASANPSHNNMTTTDFPDLPPLPERQKSLKELEQDKKDLELTQLLQQMDDWKPIIPDEVTDFYLQRAGFETDDVRVKRLLALATQRFVASIASDAFQYSRARTSTTSTNNKKDSSQSKGKSRTRTVLTMEDLSAALKEYGVDGSRAAYYL
ncbi:hypothetical protein OIO90_005659 [Microbotryomycetes sp. JL221]|nr:hypothetical protein OIO90_005659 [Microbotryomycetes sp. JL221]